MSINPTIILAQALRNMNVNPSKYIRINDAGTGFVLIDIDTLIAEINTKATTNNLNATRIDGKTITEFIESLRVPFQSHVHPNKAVLDGITSDHITTWNNKQNALGFTPEDSAQKGVADGYASLDSTGKIPTTQLPSIAKESVVVNSLDERDAIPNPYPGLQCLVIDVDAVTPDEQTTLYVCKNVTNAGLPTQSVEWVVAALINSNANLVLDWQNIHGKPTSTPGQIDTAVGKIHQHNNVNVLNKFGINLQGKLMYDNVPIVVSDSGLGELQNINLIAPADSTGTFTIHGTSGFDKDKDKILAMFYHGIRLTESEYSYEQANGTITLTGWTMFENDILNVEVEKGA